VQDVRNLADLVRRAAADGPDRPALRWHDRTLTWGELDAQVDAAAAGLAALGLESTDGAPPRVAVALPNIPEFAVVYFGALRAGLVVVPVNPGYTGRELRHVLGDAGAGALVATEAVAAALGDAAPARTYLLGGSLGDLLTPAAAPPPATGGDDLAVLLYTSGTEGEPKGAMLSHRALLANHAQVATVEPTPVGRDDVLLLCLPLFHAYGLNTGLGAVAYHGACGVLVERFDPADALDHVARHGVTVVVGVPPMFMAWSLMGDDVGALRGVRLAVCGASPLDREAARRYRAATGHPVHEGYGLTETAPIVTSTLASPDPKPGSIGRALPGVDLKLIMSGGGELVIDGPLDEDDFDDDAAGSPGSDPGEIAVRGANLFSGYWPDGRGGPDADGWWRTGDVAYADADGDLFLVDRIGELILVSGFNVYPAEVEHVLVAHPDVRAAAVLGVPHPYTGQTIKAYVVRADESTTADELIAYCEKNLARFKCPAAIEFVAELPYSAIGKVRKGVLRGA
jgi:long-chain acyl-CoA synthetase